MTEMQHQAVDQAAVDYAARTGTRISLSTLTRVRLFTDKLPAIYAISDVDVRLTARINLRVTPAEKAAVERVKIEQRSVLGWDVNVTELVRMRLFGDLIPVISVETEAETA
jgi:hypothetical protein